MIRIALIGLGKMGISHLAIIRSHPDVELVAVCDTTGYVVNTLSKYTGVKTYSDYNTMLAKEELDAVVVATPSRFHAEIVRAALKKNLHIFCEKPFCLDLEEAKQLAREAAENGLVNQVGYHYRFVAAFKEARRLLQDGVLGQIHHVRAEAYGPVVLRAKGSTWRTNRTEGGGCLFDYASHAIDLMNFLVGPPTDVSGAVLSKIFSEDVDDEVYGTFHYPGGMSGQLVANWSDDSFRKMSMKVSIWGTKGRIQADRQEVQIYYRGDDAEKYGLKKGWNVKYTTEMTEEVWYYLRGEEYSSQMDYFFKQISEGFRDPAFSFSSALETDIVISRIQSAASDTATGDIRFSPPTTTVRQKGGALQRILAKLA
ncbi:Gfo/Idh/MocA family oxidoreductase [Pararhizobium sp. LjRoot255]|uniref:Gfo/Idh/MocA family protein n=1 Tax=Pararhizobium sp. LjRoot255 TaxID=3342298 RepID=UPI003ED021D7